MKLKFTVEPHIEELNDLPGYLFFANPPIAQKNLVQEAIEWVIDQGGEHGFFDVEEPGTRTWGFDDDSCEFGPLDSMSSRGYLLLSIFIYEESAAIQFALMHDLVLDRP